MPMSREAGATAYRAAIQRAVVAGVGVTLMAGCATRRSPTLEDRFLVRDESSEDRVVPSPEPPATAPPGLEVPEIRGTVRQSASLESSDPGLAAAVERLSEQPTPESHRRVALEYWRLGVFDQADRHLTTAIELDREDARSYDLRARVWRDWGVPEYGLGDATRAAFFDPESAAVHNTLGTVLFALGQVDEAAEAFERAMALAPDAAYVRSNLCYVALVRGDSERAAARCQEAIERDASLVAAWHNQALISAAAGRIEAARRDFARHGSEAASRYNTGLVLLSLGDFSGAAVEFDKAFAADPGLTRAEAYAAAARRRAGGGGG